MTPIMHRTNAWGALLLAAALGMASTGECASRKLDARSSRELTRTVQKLSTAARAAGGSPAGGAECAPAPRAVLTPGQPVVALYPIDLEAALKLFRTSIAGPKFTHETCGPFLSEVYATVLRATPDQFDAKKLEATAPKVVRELFDAKIELREAFARLEKSAPPSSACVTAMRNVLRSALFMQEYVAEHFIRTKPQDRVFASAGPGSADLLINPRYAPADGKPLELKSGDVLLSRGDAFVSGAIARIGDDDGNYSHVAVVYVDPQTKQVHTVEAHIEVGSVVAPVERYLTDGKSRATVFRMKDPALAHRAAKEMYERVKKAQDEGKPIPYDFGMVLTGLDAHKKPADAELFCSEHAHLGYKLASGGSLSIPSHPTGLNMKNDRFLKDIGVTAKQTFAPSDMELETGFEVVAEWRNFGKTEKSRMTDAILTKMYEAMEKHDYVLEATTTDNGKAAVGYGMRHLPLFDRVVKDKFPENMSLSAIQAMMALNASAAPMLSKLKEASDAQKAKTGFAFTASQMGKFLDRLRAQDLARYRSQKAAGGRTLAKAARFLKGKKMPPAPLFHETFHPAN